MQKDAFEAPPVPNNAFYGVDCNRGSNDFFKP
jgi:hypothetical protein